MKYLLVCILSGYICSVSFAQKKNTEDPIYGESTKTKLNSNEITNNNFLIEDNKLIWQKVFEKQLDFDELQKEIKETGIIENMEVSNISIIGDLRQLSIDYKGAGYNGANTPIIITRSNLTAYCLIEFKENKYRVTLRNINLIQKSDDVLFKMGEKTSLDIMAIKDGNFRKAFIKTSSVIIDYSFSNAFSLSTDKKNDNW